MAVEFGKIKDYTVSVAERAVGINAYQRWQRYVEQLDNPSTDPIKQNRRYAGIFFGAIQLGLPAVYNTLGAEISKPRVTTEPEVTKAALSFIGRDLLSVFADAGTWYLATSLSHNPIEGVALKLAANVVAQVGIDFAEAARDRIKNFRLPASATLAI